MTPFVQQTARQKAQEASGQRTAKRKAELPQQKPIKKRCVYDKVTFAVSPLYKVRDAGGCLVESILQERVQKGARGSGMSLQ